MGASGLGALLVKEGFLTEQDRVTITKTCGQGSWAFAKCILSTGLLDEDELSAFFAERTKYVVAPKNLLDRLDPGIVEQVDRRMVSRLEVLPLEIDHHRITVAVADPLDKSTLKQLEFFTGLEVVPVIAPLSQIHEGLSRLNPEFKPRPTALSNFLRNHAGAAWIKQKIVEEGDVEIPQDHPSNRGAIDNYLEDQVEEVSLDDEIDAMDDSADNLNDIDASGLDEGAGNSDFDDIDLEDAESDLELTPGEGSIDDAGLDVDDPFDNFDDAPKKGKSVAAPADDDLEGLEASGDIGDDLWPDADDAPAKPAAKAPAKTKAKAPAPADELPDDFGLDDEPAKPAQAAGSDDLWPDADEAPAAPPAKKAAALSSDLGDDFNLGDDLSEDEDKGAEKSAAALDDDLLDETPDLGFEAEEKPKKAQSDDSGWDDLDLGAEAQSLDDPKPSAKKPAKKKSADDDMDFGATDAESLDDDLGLGLDAADAKEERVAASADGDLNLDDDIAPGSDDDAPKLDDDLGLGLDAETDDAKDELAAGPADGDLNLDDDDGLSMGDEGQAAGSTESDLNLDDDIALGSDGGSELDDDLGLSMDAEADDAKDELATASADGDLNLDDDIALGADENSKLDDDLALGSDELNDGLDDLMDEPAPKPKAQPSQAKPKAPMESTRMAQKPTVLPTLEDDPEDLVGIEFAEDEETSASLRKAVHEEGTEPEFRDPNFDDEPEETRIDLHAAIDDEMEFGADDVEDTNIRLHPVDEKPQSKKEAAPTVKDPLEDLAMGFHDDESIDEPGIDDLGIDAELDDIPIEAPATPARAGGRSAPTVENGSIASLTATAKANEALLRMSLCFDRATALEIAREYLPQISGTGCLVNIGKTTEALATWRSGAQSAAQGKAAVYQRLAKAAKPNQWSEIPVSAQDDFGSVKAISVYKVQKDDGRILLLAGDYPKDDDSLREALTSLAEQLGAK